MPQLFHRSVEHPIAEASEYLVNLVHITRIIDLRNFIAGDGLQRRRCRHEGSGDRCKVCRENQEVGEAHRSIRVKVPVQKRAVDLLAEITGEDKEVVKVDLPDKVKVGVAAINNVAQDFTVRFQRLKIE